MADEKINPQKEAQQAFTQTRRRIIKRKRAGTFASEWSKMKQPTKKEVVKQIPEEKKQKIMKD